MSKKRHEKVKAIIKTFLVTNKGQWFTAREICEFIISHNFGLGQYYVSVHSVSKLLRQTDGIFRDIETMKVYETKRYRYNGNG